MILDKFPEYEPETSNPNWKAWEHEKSVVGRKAIEVTKDFTPEILDNLENDRQTIFFGELGKDRTPFFLFRDHDSSFNAWAWFEAERNEDLGKMSVIHIDAHADLPWNQDVEKFSKPDSTESALKKTAGYSTYLIPAAVDGYLGQLYWLGASRDNKQFITPNLSQGGTRASVDVKPETNQSAIAYFTASSTDALLRQTKDTLDQKYALDIDLDYFLDGMYLSGDDSEVKTKFDSRLTSTIAALSEIITTHGKPKIVTVSYSPAYCRHKEKAQKIVQDLVELISN